MIPRKVIKTRAASDEELEWIKYGRKLCQDSPDIIDAQAKALVTLASSLLLVYTSALTLFKISENFNLIITHLIGANSNSETLSLGVRLVILGLPIILWLWSIRSSLGVYHPNEYEVPCILSPYQVAHSLETITIAKFDKLKGAMKFFLLALAWSTVCIGIMSILTVPATITPEPQEVQLIISSSSIPAFQSMSIAWNETDMKTLPIKMLDESDAYLKVQLEDGRIAKFNRTLIQGIIYLERQLDDINKTT